ncbi:MAG: RodZ domain-containing protein [Spongiibacteraceae bacterium]
MNKAADTVSESIVTISPGQVLREARERAQMTTREVADILHLVPRQIAELEADDYQQFSGALFCKGYIKSYAHIFNMDATPLIEAYLQLCPAAVIKKGGEQKRLLNIQRPHKGHSLQYWCLAAAVAVLVALWWLGSSPEIYAQADDVELAPVVVDKYSDLARKPEDRVLAAVAVPEEADDDFATNNAADDSASSKDVLVVQQEVEVATSLAAVENYIEQAVADTLDLSFADDCWVEVRDRNNKLLFSNLKRGSDTLTIKGEAPFNVLLGYAPGVVMEYNGELVTISVNPENNAAQIVVGESS